MNSFHDYLNAGNAWLFIPAAILLGALHGLEPGHSKTMMAAFIASIQGTATQALLLGLAATISHTGVIWILALIGLRYSQELNVETLEPYFQAGIGLLVIAMAAWTFSRTRTAKLDHQHTPEHGRQGGTMIDGGHGFTGTNVHSHAAELTENHHRHDATFETIAPEEYQDAHERAHAVEIQERFANRRVTTGQIVLFGLTGGLIPCPAAFAVLLVCLQLKRVALGFALVMAFSLGLAITLMTVGVIAAFSVKHVTKHFKGFGNLVRRAPCFSAAIMLAVGMFVLVHGVRNLLH